nr:PREDICTED: uncharacterized protein LOC105678736 isoform X2 [Linepithema humile]
MNFISVIARTTNMRLQRYSNVYLLIPLYYTLAAVNAQVVTEESNIGFISGNITTANDRRTKITPISALAMLEAMTMLKGMRYEKRYLQ